MDFFNKYKNLFEIPSGLSVPQSRLRLDNDLFVERVYQGTTQQEYSLNNKLRELKKDYSQFENEMQDIAVMRKTPKRSLSRKGKDGKEEKSFGVAQKNNENREYLEKMQPAVGKMDYQKEKQRLLDDMLKRESWLQDEHKNILKHSELDHIFNNKLNKIYDLDEIKVTTLPKVDHNDHFSMDNQSKRNNFLIKQRSRRNTEAKSPNNQRKQGPSTQTALARREKAKSTLQHRRKKLEQLLKTLW